MVFIHRESPGRYGELSAAGHGIAGVHARLMSTCSIWTASATIVMSCDA